MPDGESRREQAERAAAEARAFERTGHAERTLAALHKAVLLYAAADAEREAPEEAGPLTRPRADACRSFADTLAAVGRYAEAANVYQEATDLYGLIAEPEARDLASDCARRLLASVAEVRAQPRERLHLLVAHYERAQEQLALEPGTEARQAECRMHIARIYQRRDRPADSAESYRESLALLGKTVANSKIALARAECNHRIATLLAEALGEPVEAMRHYRDAIELYQAHEPLVYGFQQSAELCRAALARLEEAALRQNNGRDREWSRD